MTCREEKELIKKNEIICTESFFKTSEMSSADLIYNDSNKARGQSKEQKIGGTKNKRTKEKKSISKQPTIT